MRLGGGRCHAGDVTACGKGIQQQTQCDNIHRLCAQPTTGAVAQPQELQMWGSKERAHNTSLPGLAGPSQWFPCTTASHGRTVSCPKQKAPSHSCQAPNALLSGVQEKELTRVPTRHAHIYVGLNTPQPNLGALPRQTPLKFDSQHAWLHATKTSKACPPHPHVSHRMALAQTPYAHTHGFDCRPATIRAPNHRTLRFPPSPGRHRPPCTQR